jgi:hypothetical protein
MHVNLTKLLMVILCPWSFGIVFLAGGLIAIAGGLFNWDWFMDNQKAQVFVEKFGRSGARVFYCVLGLAFAGLGLFMVTAFEPPW